MGGLVCNYLLDEASREHEFLSMKRQDGHLRFEPKRNLRLTVSLEQAKVAIA
jgi:hypothetical protein